MVDHPTVPGHDALPEPSRHEALHRLTARLAVSDLDPATVEILTAVLTLDLDLRSAASGEGSGPRHQRL